MALFAVENTFDEFAFVVIVIGFVGILFIAIDLFKPAARKKSEEIARLRQRKAEYLEMAEMCEKEIERLENGDGAVQS